jgi:glycosyltransferase involved in cell wall biosynthesis
MRIVVATDVTVKGGVDNYVVALLDALLRHGHEAVLLFEKDTASPVGALAAERGVEAVPLPLYRSWHHRDVAEAACRSLLAAAQPNGIHIVNGSPRSCLALRSVAIELGIDLAITEQQVSQELRLPAAHRAEIRASYSRAVAVVFVTPGNRETMAKAVGLDGTRSVVISNGVDLGPIGQYRKTVLRPQIPARLISVARLAPEKSLATLVSAMSLLPRDLVHELNIYGDGPAEPELAQQIMRLGLGSRVFLRGWKADVAPLLREHDIFVLPSIAEGMPYALLEAMAVGLPAVCTDVPGTIEALAAGDAGRVVPRSDPRALADGILDCLNDPDLTEVRARAAMSRVRLHHEQALLMDRTVQLWEGVDSRHNRKDAPHDV